MSAVGLQSELASSWISLAASRVFCARRVLLTNLQNVGPTGWRACHPKAKHALTSAAAACITGRRPSTSVSAEAARREDGRRQHSELRSLGDTRTTGAGRLLRHDGPGANDGLTARPRPIRERDLIRIEQCARVSKNGRAATSKCRSVGLLGLGCVRWLGDDVGGRVGMLSAWAT